MKRLISMMLVILLALSLCACGSGSASDGDEALRTRPVRYLKCSLAPTPIPI